MLLHYIELISEYQDSRRSEDVGEPSSDIDTPQQDTPDMPPPPELVQSIKSAGGDLPACDAVIVQNLQALSQQTGRHPVRRSVQARRPRAVSRRRHQRR